MSVSVTLVRTLVEEMARAGVDPRTYLEAAQLDPALLEDPNARLSEPQYDRLQELALDLTGDPALGVHMAERVNPSAFHVVGFLSGHCHTLRQAIEMFTRYRKLLSDATPPELAEDGDTAVLTLYFVAGGSPRSNRLRAEFGVASITRTALLVLGVPQPPQLVEMPHPAPPYAAEVERVLGCPVRYDSDAIRLHFPRAWLDAARLHANPELMRLLEHQAERNLADLVTPRRLSARVRAAVLDGHDGTRPTMTAMARRLGLSERSLRRRLAEENLTYNEVVEQALAEAARRMLEDPAVTIQEVADRLGFSEASAFHRAFKRWTGQTPRQFRDQPEGS
jgi:AraC-like DNA-binding protein